LTARLGAGRRAVRGGGGECGAHGGKAAHGTEGGNAARGARSPGRLNPRAVAGCGARGGDSGALCAGLCGTRSPGRGGGGGGGGGGRDTCSRSGEGGTRPRGVRAARASLGRVAGPGKRGSTRTGDPGRQGQGLAGTGLGDQPPASDASGTSLAEGESGRGGVRAWRGLWALVLRRSPPHAFCLSVCLSLGRSHSLPSPALGPSLLCVTLSSSPPLQHLWSLRADFLLLVSLARLSSPLAPCAHLCVCLSTLSSSICPLWGG
jgi:hypothetical protein